MIGFQQLSGSFAPAGIALDPSGDLYVTDNGGATIQRLSPNPADASLVASGTIQLSTPAGNLNGVARTTGGRLLVSTINGSGVFQYDTTSGQSAFNSSPIASGQVAISANGTVAVGGVVFSSFVSLFDPNGTQTGGLEINATYLPQPALPYTSADQTSPQGVAFNGAGNLIVTAMGRTNPFSAGDNFQSNGGIFVFNATGTTLLDSLVNTTPYTGVIVAPVPEPSAFAVVATGGFAVAMRGRRKLRRPT
jgi:sugar lactone lactonase YvrE